ncbi:MAG: acriflavin resistance protein [Candidatus Eremiobacteraeota bacterium]|nr:acriflavin resistance protein [Candidatus Eremiobacteraeota bacterium]
MRLTRIFLKRPTLVFVFIALTLFAGAFALRSLVVQDMPNIGLRGITVVAAYPGASTTGLVTEIAEPLENQIVGTPYLDHIDTTIQSGQVSISAQFSLQSTDTENIANVQKAVQAAQRQLPSTVTPTIRVADPSEPTVISLALVSSKYPQTTLATLANNQIVPVIGQLAGVSNVTVTGQTQAAFMVTVDPNVLQADNLTLTDVVSAISPNNARLPGGIVYQPGRETALDIRGDLADPQSVAKLPIHVAYTAASGGTQSNATARTGSAGAGTAVTNAAATSSAAANETASAGNRVRGVPVRIAPRPSATVPPEVLSAATTVPLESFSPAPFATTAARSNTSTSEGTSPAPAPAPSNLIGFAGPPPPSAQRTSSTGASGALTAGANVVVDQPVNPPSVSSNSASLAANASPAMPPVSSGAYGSGAGTSMSPFVGALAAWAVPSADKRIGDIATVTNGNTVQRIYSSQNGKPGVTLQIQKKTEASEVTVADEVVKALPGLRAKFSGVDFQIEHNQATYTEQQVAGVEHTLVEGIVLTAFVMLFFLRSWRNAVVVMIAIPTSLGVTLFVMKLLNLTLDTVSLMAMTLVIGILVDDSTVVLENIERHRSLGEPPPDAAFNGRTEIGLAAIVITMVDVVVFLPIVFIGGQIAQVLAEFAIVITIATLTSLFVSFTVTPTLAGLWSMKSTWRPWPIICRFTDRFEATRRAYAERWLPDAFRHPWPLAIGATLACVGAYLLVPLGWIGEEFVPAQDQGVITAQVAFPPGHPLDATHAVMNRLEVEVNRLIADRDLQYETTVSGAYSAPFGGFVQEGNAGQITVFLRDDRSRPTDYYVKTLEERLPRVAPGANVTVAAAQTQGGGSAQPIDELVSTTNGRDPAPYAAKLFEVLRATPGATGVQNSESNAAPQMEVQFDRARLQALDVGTGTASQAVQAAFGGVIATQIETPDRGLTDVEVIYPHAAQTSLAAVLAIPVRAQNGSIVRIGDFAMLHYAPAPLVITRENRATVIHLSANVAPGASLSGVTNAFMQRVSRLHLPTYVTVRPAALGQQALMTLALLTLGGSLMVSIALVFFMIVALYNSYRTPFVTMFAIPLATVGALGALWITHNTLNLFSLIGIILLVGLVTKNGILLVDFADMERRRGKSREEAMRAAAAIRFRPIMMTTVAMVAGMFPLALGLEPGGGSRASLAIVVIGGLTSSLILTLFIVPIMYRWIAPEHVPEETKFLDEERERRPQEGWAPA